MDLIRNLTVVDLQALLLPRSSLRTMVASHTPLHMYIPVESISSELLYAADRGWTNL